MFDFGEIFRNFDFGQIFEKKNSNLVKIAENFQKLQI